MQIKADPYDEWERFKLPLIHRIFSLFLSKNEREEIKLKIDTINKIRMLDKKKELDEIKALGIKRVVGRIRTSQY